LKTQPKQFLGSVPLSVPLPALSKFLHKKAEDVNGCITQTKKIFLEQHVLDTDAGKWFT
jgi:hypothetical protein